MKNLMKMIMKKKGGADDMSPEEIQAKMDVIQELLDLAGNSQGKNIAGKLQKVSVAAPSKEGLLEGMDKAKEVVSEAPEVEESEDDSEEGDESVKEALMESLMTEAESKEPEHSLAPESEDDEMEGLSFMEKRKRKMERMGQE